MPCLSANDIKKEDPISWEFNEKSIQRMWNVDEISIEEDKRHFVGEDSVVKKIFAGLIAFVQQGDDDIVELIESKIMPTASYMELIAMRTKAVVEQIHALFYSKLIDVLDEEGKRYLEEWSNNLAVKEKLDVNRDIGDLNKAECHYAMANREGIFFVSVFNIFFWLKSGRISGEIRRYDGSYKGNNLVRFEEKMHEDYHDKKALELRHLLSNDFIVSDLCRVVEAEMRNIDAYVVDFDGLRADDLKLAVKCLANERIIKYGLSPLYPEAHPDNLPHYITDTVMYKTNYYERLSSTYSKPVDTPTWTFAGNF
jgi:ribonucleotide reductase beta subunit family protein with ferritin-like domain